MKKIQFSISIVLCFVTTFIMGQQRPMTTKSTNMVNFNGALPARDTVDYQVLFKLLKKYGIEKNLSWSPDVKGTQPPKRAPIILPLPELEKLIASLAFEEKRAKIIDEFYNVRFPELKSGKELVMLKREYLKKYPEYLKDLGPFKEETLLFEEKNAEGMWLNNKHFKKN